MMHPFALEDGVNVVAKESIARPYRRILQYNERILHRSALCLLCCAFSCPRLLSDKAILFFKPSTYYVEETEAALPIHKQQSHCAAPFI